MALDERRSTFRDDPSDLRLVILVISMHSVATNMARTFLVFGMAAYVVMPTLAAGPIRNEFFSNAETRLLRKDARQTGNELMALSRITEEAPKPPIVWIATVGASYTDTQNSSKTWLTPFEIDAIFNEKRTIFKVTGDGYGHSTSDTGNAHGLNDPTFTISQAVFKDKLSLLRIAGGVTVPVGGEFGGTSAKQRLSTAYTRTISERWGVLISGKLTRLNEDQPTGVGRIGQSGLLQASYTFADAPDSNTVSHDVLFQLTRAFRSGAGGSSQAAITYDFPITSKLGGAFTFTRGITAGTRDNSVEFDLTFPF